MFKSSNFLGNNAPSDLHIQNPLVSSIEAWKVDGTGVTGLPLDDLRHRHLLISLQAEPGERFQILLRIFFPDMTLVKMKLETPSLTPYSSPFNSFSFGFMLAGFAAGLMSITSSSFSLSVIWILPIFPSMP